MAVPRDRGFVQVDVFGTGACLGNALAVVLDGDGLTEQDMARLARWTNLSETAFLLAPTTSEADYRVRVFTRAAELPFAGHPTLGAAHAWLEAGGAPRRAGRLVQECGVGLVDVREDCGTLAFAAPPTLRAGPLDEPYLADLAAAFGIARSEIIAHQWVDNGPGWAVVRLSCADEVLGIDPDLSKIPQAKIGALGAYPAGGEHAFEIRAFAPAMGIPEDPVTGSLNAGVAQWLIREGEAPLSFRVSQGARVGRAGSVRVEAEPDGTVWIGGACATLIQGRVTL